MSLPGTCAVSAAGSPLSCSSSLELLTAAERAAWSLSTSAWRYDAWLQSYPLNTQTVLDYFKHSPYYDLSANNERLSNTAASSSSLQLRHMEGVEYEVETGRSAADASFFLIRKQRRISPTSARLLSLYHVIGSDPPPSSSSSSSSLPLPRGSVIPLPAFAAVCRCAVDSTLAAVNTAMQTHHSSWYSNRQEQLTAAEQKDGSGDDDEEQEDEESGGAAFARPAAAASASSRPSPSYAQLADDELRRLLTSAGGGGQRAETD